MSIATILVWKESSLGWYKSIQSWFVLPIFITVILLSVILLVFTALISTVNADFCSGGSIKNPAGTILDIMKEQMLDIGAAKYQVVLNYSHGCTLRSDPLEFIQKLEINMKDAMKRVSEKIDEIPTSEELLKITSCDFSPMINLKDLLRGMLIQLEKMKCLTIQAQRISDCNRVHNVYNDIFNGTVCTNTAEGFVWLAICLTFITFFGMVMITLRSAWMEVEFVDEFKDMLIQQDVIEDADNDDEDYMEIGSNRYSIKSSSSRQEIEIAI